VSTPVGYCIGGTLLAMTLAYLAARGDDIGSATFMVSLQDFSEVGDTAVFMDEPQIEFMERRMLERGYLDSSDMAKMFNLLRSNDLIWNTVINSYLMGNKPSAFDLLYWNDDGTRMVPAAHGFYLHNTYLDNNLIKRGKISLLGQPIDLRRRRGSPARKSTTAVGGAIGPNGSRLAPEGESLLQFPYFDHTGKLIGRMHRPRGDQRAK
jgi:polyhydroxyalkanoate synthase subunit PhaC